MERGARLVSMNDLDIGTTLFGVSSPQHWFGEDLETAELARG